MTKDEALDLALEFVEANHSGGPDAFKLITAIKQARSAKVQEPSGLTNRYTAAQPAPVQEPVAGQCRFPNVAWSQCDPAHVRMVLDNPHEWKGYEVRYLYTTPPAAQRQWVGLTNEEITQICVGLWSGGWRETAMQNFARAIEAKLKKENT